jgi:hypothetical protein
MMKAVGVLSMLLFMFFAFSRTLIVGTVDITAISGPGKSFVVCRHGDNLALIYGDPTPDLLNYIEIKIAYSTDFGDTWTTYGPFSGEIQRSYPGLDGSPDFCTNPGELYFTWHESPSGYQVSDQLVMIEEGVPSASSPSTPLSLPHAPNVIPWYTDIAVSPDDPLNIIATGWSVLVGGNCWAYCWISQDGGYTWTDTIPMCYIDPDGKPGHIRFGHSDYVFYAYHDTYDWHGTQIVYPYYIESTDGGYTWSVETPLPEVPVLDPAHSWFWSLDCEVINNELWTVHHDINQVTPDSADMWVFHGTGSPGSWAWDITSMHDYDLNTVVADTAFVYEPGQYPSIAYDPVSGTILIGCKAYYFKAYPAALPTDTIHDGAHVGGIFSWDNGMNWHVTRPLSEPNTAEIAWDDWGATEIAHRLVDLNHYYAYSIWVHRPEMNIYLERDWIYYWPWGIEETARCSIGSTQLNIKPSIAKADFIVSFNTRKPGRVSLDLYDVSGRFVTELHDGYVDQGEHRISVDAQSLPSGTYYVVLENGAQRNVSRVAVVK